ARLRHTCFVRGKYVRGHPGLWPDPCCHLLVPSPEEPAASPAVARHRRTCPGCDTLLKAQITPQADVRRPQPCSRPTPTLRASTTRLPGIVLERGAVWPCCSSCQSCSSAAHK